MLFPHPPARTPLAPSPSAAETAEYVKGRLAELRMKEARILVTLESVRKEIAIAERRIAGDAAAPEEDEQEDV